MNVMNILYVTKTPQTTEEWRTMKMKMEKLLMLLQLTTYSPYLCTQTNYIPFVRYCSHYTIADSVVVLLLLIPIYPSHSLHCRSVLFCFAESSDSVDSAVECLYMALNKDSIYSNCSSLNKELNWSEDGVLKWRIGGGREKKALFESVL